MPAHSQTPHKLVTLISEEQIHTRIAELGLEISRDYAGRKLAVVAVMKGAIFFLVDLLRKIDLPVRLDLVHVSSYRGEQSTGQVKTLKGLSMDVSGCDVLIVDDILDTGLTLSHVVAEVQQQSPASIRICVLLDKQTKRKVSVAADYAGFEIPDRFVVGYGLDYNDYYRQLPYIAVLTPPD